MKYWKKLSNAEIKERVFAGLKSNVNYHEEMVLGIPVSELDDRVFTKDDLLLSNAPFLSAMVANPNHIGCHTMGESEAFFNGTQEIERELIELIGTDILKGEAGEQDGYVASGGTEANMQAIWIYRNYFRREFNAKNEEIAILCSEDSHYSMPKAANILNIPIVTVAVDDSTRLIKGDDLAAKIQEAKANGIRCFVTVANMMTTMFGSVDSIDVYANALKKAEVEYKIHVDGAYGGFVYPFCDGQPDMSLQNPEITSITLDAHKMVQAPFGTGVFIIRKGWMQYATTEEAQYVQGMDATMIGSRSGANAISVWMILMTYGPHGWFEKIHILNYRTAWLCNQLKELGIEFYRHPASNIVTMRAKCLPEEVIKKYKLVPDSHGDHAEWYKIVLMSHVTVDLLVLMLEDLKKCLVAETAH